MTSAFELRPFTSGEIPGFETVAGHAFHEAPSSEQRRQNFAARMEWDRTLAAFDGTTMVGTAGAFSFRMHVPGAMAAVAGVTIVSVLPSHRRRGILTAMMRHQLGDVHERGEAVAALHASEAGIYRRFGYGAASWDASFTLHRAEGGPATGGPADPGLRLRLAEPGSVRAELAAVHDAELARRPGFFARSGAWWDRVLADPEQPGGPGPLRCVVAADESGPRGYALYTAQGTWDEDAGLPAGVLVVREALATDPAAAAAIWADLLSRDLAATFRLPMRPLDDPLPQLIADPRRVRTQVSDSLWVRLVDVGAALAQRRYACPVDAVIDVSDDFCPWNSGRWRLTAGPGTGGAGPDGAGYAAVCERTTAPADLAAPAHALGAAYLGGTRLGGLAAAGLVSESRPGALLALSTAMSWDPAPWCPLIF